MERMDPTGMLVQEHGLIERVVADIKRRTGGPDAGADLPLHYALAVADFFHSYADACHHGKEEYILFERLGTRALSPEDEKAMQGLIREHAWARSTTAKLRQSGDRYAHGDSSVLGDIAKSLRALAQFYPQHIKKENESFFPASRRYFTDDEWDAMAEEFREFDRGLIHERYRGVVDEIESGTLETAAVST